MKKSRKIEEKATSKQDTSIVNEPEYAYQTTSASTGKHPSTFVSISSFLGKNKGIPQSIDSVANKHQYISLIREGVKMQNLLHLMEVTDINSTEAANILHTSERTLRRYTNDTILNPEQSERIIELARLFSRGAEVFGSLDNFKVWMNTPVVALGTIKPKELLDTSLGIEILQEELGRIEQGIFA